MPNWRNPKWRNEGFNQQVQVHFNSMADSVDIPRYVSSRHRISIVAQSHSTYTLNTVGANIIHFCGRIDPQMVVYSMRTMV